MEEVHDSTDLSGVSAYCTTLCLQEGPLCDVTSLIYCFLKLLELVLY